MSTDPAVRSLVKAAILPPDGWALIGTATSVLSVVYFVHHGFDVGIGAALSILINYYEQVVSVFPGAAKPYIEAMFAWMGWKVFLYPHWKHIFVLLTLYFLSGARVEFGEYRAGRGS